MAQPSTSAAANSGHDVFINHRGPDSKKTFASHLYRRLLSSGLKVFLDQPELQRGDDFSVQIEQEIRSASVHVAIFSEGYADSRWCLDELVQMLDTKAPIIPVFYHVKPDELRGTRGKKRTYAEALDEQAKKTDYDGQTPRHDPSKIQKWRDALREVANRSGFELEACNGDEGELLDQVVDEVLKRVKKVALPRDVGKYPTGLDEKVEDFEKILLQQQQSGKPQVLGIVGLGGIGKTTLATEFFNRKRSDYSRSCFFPDVKNKVKDKELIELQIKLLKMLNVADEKIKKVTDVPEGKEMIRKHISSSFKALLVIDDVDHDDQVDALLPHTSVIDRDSLILITSRNRQVLRNSNVEEESIYTLSGLSEEHSLELFCSYSFPKSRPPQEFEFLVNKFLEACGGLPLSLKVFGALLRGKSISYWEDQLCKLGRTLHKEIMGKLKISYDALDKEEKEMFLDIACFFIGEDRDMVVRILGEGFQNIQDRCLVEVDPEKKIRMHDHLRDMGRELAKASELPRRLWRWTEDDMYDMLQQSSVTDVRGLRMDREYTHIDDAIRMRRLRFLDAKGDLVERILTKVQSSNLIWLRWNHCPFSSLSSLPFRVPMEKLRVLHLQGFKLEELWKKESETPLQLRELQIQVAPLFDIPKSIGRLKHLEQIVISPMNRSKVIVGLRKLPEEFCLLQSLKYLVLDSCCNRLPESFGNLSNLQQIKLVNCSGLQRLPESFGNLTNLLHIKLHMCYDLERLPDSFGKLIKLQYLHLECCFNLTMSSETLGDICTLEYINLNGCGKIEVLPTQVAHQRSLEQLSLRGTNLKELPSAIGELSDLEVLEVEESLLEMLPPSVCGLSNLKELSIVRCDALNCLPASLGDLKNLKEFWIENCNALNCLPASLGDLKNLKELRIVGCNALNCLPASLGDLKNLKELRIEHCNALNCLPASLGDLKNLKELRIELCHALYCLPASLADLENLKELRIKCCDALYYLPASLGDLKNLKELSIQFCNALYCLPDSLCDLKNLKQLRIENCNALNCLPDSLGDLKNLEEFWIENCNALNCLPASMGDLKNLKELRIDYCKALKCWPASKEEEGEGERGTLNDLNSSTHNNCILPGLQRLYLSHMKISEVSFPKGVCCCNLEWCNNVVEVGTLPNTLTHLSFERCSNLRRIDKICGLAQLQSLYISDCTELEELPSIETLISLTHLTARECWKLKRIRGLGQLTKLRNLRVGGCLELEEVEGIQHCRSLIYVDVSGCHKLQLSAGVVEQLQQRCIAGVSGIVA